MSVEVLTLGAGERAVEVAVRRSHRKTLAITVFPDGEVVANAPIGAPLTSIDEKIRVRTSWIMSTRRAFEAYRPRTPRRRYVRGETHRYLGRQLRLDFSPDSPLGVRVDGSTLLVAGIPTSQTAEVERAVRRWYQACARNGLADRLGHCIEAFAQDSIERPSLTVRSLARRWGSMSADGKRMLLNTRLIEAPVTLIDYVVVHELCHILAPNHGRQFFDLLQLKMPDWADRKQRLERLMA